VLESLVGRALIIGVDRLDYWKAIAHRVHSVSQNVSPHLRADLSWALRKNAVNHRSPPRVQHAPE
jgi:trehalose-6-phosphate synthase